jgi:hypothetical protein
MQDMKDLRQAPAAAVFEEARVESFGDGILELSFPKELAIYAKLASDTRHTESLQDALERNFGIKPRLESRVGEGDAGSNKETLPPPEAAAPAEEPVREESGNVPGTQEASSVLETRVQEAGPEVEPAPEVPQPPEDGGTTEAGGGDDTIGSEQEAFALAREWFGTSDKNGGS